MATRRVTFRLYPKPNAEKKLRWARKMHKDLYNAAIANRKTQYERYSHSVSYYEQQNSLPAFKEVLTEYKLQEAGGFLVTVPTKKVKPSQTCPDCGHQRKKDRSERVHQCSECDATYDRDVAAAMVMLSWALLNQRPQSWRGNPYF